MLSTKNYNFIKLVVKEPLVRMIPKIIHYAWIGTEMPQRVKERVKMWKKELPDWKFMFWNETNYDFKKFEFTKQCYDHQKWAYATDELRFDVVNKYGGFYLDTDMLINKNLEKFRGNKVTLGFMYDNSILTSFFGAEKGHPLLNEVLNFYKSNYTKLNKTTNNPIVTYYLLHKFENLKLTDKTFDKGDFDLQKYTNLSFGVYHGEILEVELLFSQDLSQEASQFNFHPTQSGKWNDDGTYTVNFKASGSREIIWHVFRWGAGCKIVTPKSLKEEYKKYLKENLDNY